MRLLPAIASLPEFDQSVYRLVIEQGLSRESCFQKLKLQNPDLTRKVVANALERIHSVLTPRQRWQIMIQNRGRTRSGEIPIEDHLAVLPDPGPGPEAEARRQQRDHLLERALARLSADQRLLLYWRYQEGLSLGKIADLARLGSVNTAWRHVQEAVQALARKVRDIERAQGDSPPSTG